MSTTTADLITALGDYVTARSEELYRRERSGEFDLATADARLSELMAVMSWLRLAMLAELATARDAVDRLGGEVE